MTDGQRPTGDARGHETSDVNVANVAWIGLALYGVIALVALTLWALLADLYRRYPPTPTPQHPPAIRNLPSTETDPAAELRAYRKRERAVLENYGWINPQQGIVRLPIERAMQLYAERAGTPQRPAP